MKQLPTSAIFQLLWQQSSLVGLQAQCFCRIQKLMPSLDQSIAKHVGLDLSKMHTPSSNLWIMTDFDSSKMQLRSSPQ